MAAGASEHPEQVVVLDNERARRFLRNLATNSFLTIMYVDGEIRVYMKGCDEDVAKEMLVDGLAAFVHH